MSIRILMVAAALTLALIGCEDASDRNPTSIELGDAAMMRLNLVVPTNLNIYSCLVTIAKGDLEYSQTVVFQDGSATLLFTDLQPGVWQIEVGLYDVEGVLIYEGSGEAVVHGGQTATAHIVLTELTGDLEVVIELPADANVLFEDHFTDGMSEEWISVKPVQWVENGWLLTQADGSYGRDSYAFVHDGDLTWTDYELRLVADPLPTAGFDRERGEIYFRTSEIGPTYYAPEGNYYRLFLVSPVSGPGIPPALGLVRHREDGSDDVILFDGTAPLTADPGEVSIRLTGPRIRISVDGAQVVDLIDPDPLLYGGVGVGAIWECRCRFDDVVVTSGPTPTEKSNWW